MTRPLRVASPGRAAATGAVMLALTAPGQTASVSVFVDPMIHGLGIDRAAVSAAYLAGTLAAAACLVPAGALIDRWGVRRSLILIASGFGLALAGMGSVHALPALAVGFAGIRWLGAGALNLLSTTAVTVWVKRSRRGTALGVATGVGAAGISVAPLLLQKIIDGAGWRPAWFACAAVVWLVLLSLAGWGLPARTHAGDDADPASAPSGPAGQRSDDAANQPVRGGLLLGVLCAAVAVSSLTGTALVFHQTSLLASHGLSATAAAATFVPQTGAALLAAVLAGRAADRIAPLHLITPAMVLTAGAAVLAMYAAPGSLVLFYAVVLGASIGAIRAVEAAAIPYYFGAARTGRVRGVTLTANVAAAALGPLPLAWAHTQTGSYTPALLACTIAPMLVTFAAITLARTR